MKKLLFILTGVALLTACQ
ncbi:MAG: lipoprotein, partial [Bacteroidaceae bacterium]|nr:lipoprotein [Bacteroidaceae bacterium]MBQ5839309.1 lipoprotein [Bacteroidaceae bacterium]